MKYWQIHESWQILMDLPTCPEPGKMCWFLIEEDADWTEPSVAKGFMEKIDPEKHCGAEVRFKVFDENGNIDIMDQVFTVVAYRYAHEETNSSEIS